MQSCKADDRKYRTTSPDAPSLTVRPANAGNPACLATSGQLIADRVGARPDTALVCAQERSRDRGDLSKTLPGWLQRWPSVRGHFVREESLGQCAGGLCLLDVWMWHQTNIPMPPHVRCWGMSRPSSERADVWAAASTSCSVGDPISCKILDFRCDGMSCRR